MNKHWVALGNLGKDTSWGLRGVMYSRRLSGLMYIHLSLLHKSWRVDGFVFFIGNIGEK